MTKHKIKIICCFTALLSLLTSCSTRKTPVETVEQHVVIEQRRDESEQTDKSSQDMLSDSQEEQQYNTEEENPSETITPSVNVQIDSSPIIDSAKSDPDDIYDATGFVSVSEFIPDVILEIRYYSTYNFVGSRINGYEEPIALLSKEAARALSNACDDLREKGYRIKIFDAYRPQTAVDHFADWAGDEDDTRMKSYFYPDIDKSLLFDYGYIAHRSGHSKGCAIDVTLFDMSTGKDVDMGSTFDYFGQLSHTDYTGITDEQYNNRMILREAMLNNGFEPLSTEWWHFTLADEPYPYTYFAFPVSSASLEPHE